MPIEIKEMHLNIKVNNSGPATHDGPKHKRRETGKQEAKVLVEEYYEAVLGLINNKKER